MRLAIIAQSYLFDKTASINGTLVQLYNLSRGFQKAGIEVHYVCMTNDRSKPEVEVLNGVHFYWIQSQVGLLEWKRTLPLYKNRLNKIAPDAVYVRGRNVLQYVAGNYAKTHNKVYVWGTNGDDSAELYKNVKRLKNVNKSILKKIALFPLKAFEDMYINKGMKMANIIVNQSIEQKIATKKNLGKTGIILPSYFYLPPQKETSKENLILWFANLSEAKQPEVFIDIINKIDSRNWNVILAGGSNVEPYEKKIKELTKNTDIETVGKVDFKDSFQYYQQAKIYINTSKPDADGLPNAYIQSWLSGAIVLSLHHDPNKWMQTHNIGYCSNGDINKLVLKLQELLDNPHLLSKMSKNTKPFAEQQFSNETIINSYLNLFQKNA